MAVLLCLGLLNVTERAAWKAVEDGVFWAARPDGVTALDVAADSPAAVVGVLPGDVLVAIDARSVGEPADVTGVLQRSTPETVLEYTLVRRGEPRFLTLQLAPVPQGNRLLYFLLAGVGLFTLLVGASVRLKRPSDQATLHFFWLCLAFFGTFTFSHTGRFDRLDWFFYWADVVSILMLPPLFLHFSLVFPERAPRWDERRIGRVFLPVLYGTTAVLAAVRIVALGGGRDALAAVRVVAKLDRLEPLYLSVCLVGGLVLFINAMKRVRSVTARRQLRWIVWGTALGVGPVATVYALPYAAGFDVPRVFEFLFVPLSLLPLAFASAIVRYRLMDVEVIIKRGLMYAAMASAILLIYAILLRIVGVLFVEELLRHNTIIAMLATLIVVLLAPPVKAAIQTGIDRVFYRDRYDYRRALVAFARDLNSDLDIDRLAERLVTRIRETLLVDRIALMLADEQEGGFAPLRAIGFPQDVPPLPRQSAIAERLGLGHAVALDDPETPRRFQPGEIAGWYDQEIHYFVPCVSKSGTIAVVALGRKEMGEPLSSEDVTLLGAVAGQAATALENGRLYRHLHVKAQELDRLREFNESIVESLDQGLIVLDADERVLRWNRAMDQIYGLDRSQAIGRRIDEVFDPPFIEALRTARREHPDVATLYRIPLVGRGTRRGGRFLVNATSMPLHRREEAGAPGPADGGSLVMIEDITERVQLEEQLQIADKMASVGLLAAGVAHEVNTPLTGISSFTQMLLEGADPSDPRTQALEKIEQQTFRAAKIVNGLLNLSRPSQAASEPTLVDMNVVLGDVLALVGHQLSADRIKVRRDLCPSPVLVSGFEHKLQQVFLNLFLNARDAMPRGGWLSVSSRIDRGAVRVEVADTGSGIPNEHLSRIYDPFFTTKAIGKGTGLGLSITYGIVREHDGTIDCQSGVGQGTRFVLLVPHAQAAARITSA
ncbi:MAG TPA: ATP-binding protein [Candidatus Limnocylindrales bacterium]|nr:ATP-binding protein [Candidatus Limnocylindrales bacterium]